MTKPMRTNLVDPLYQTFLLGIQKLLQEARQQAARSINVILTASYWEIGRRIVEFEQHGTRRAEYGEGFWKGFRLISPKILGEDFQRTAWKE